MALSPAPAYSRSAWPSGRWRRTPSAREAGRIGRHEGERIIRVAAIFREIEMHPSDETPAAVARFQKILEGELALGELDFQGALHGLPERNQDLRSQIFAALHRRRLVDQRGEIARGRRGKVTSPVRLRRFSERAEIGDEAVGEIAPPDERRRQAAARLAGAELQKAVAGTSREALLEPLRRARLPAKIRLRPDRGGASRAASAPE